MLILYYFRWNRTSNKFKEYIGRLQSIYDGIEGINLKGMFVPASEWSFVQLIETVSFDKALEAY